MSSLIQVGPVEIPISDLEFKATKSGGPGGQHVNKVSSAVRLNFDILHSSLPDNIKVKLLQSKDHRISKDGVFSIKVSKTRSQSKNKKFAIGRFIQFLTINTKQKKQRVPTKISKAVRQKRSENKKKKSAKKSDRRKVPY